MIFYIMGKSASGKDSMYKKILSSGLNLMRYAIYTTRPKRDGEIEGVEYHFVNEKFLDDNSDKIIEKRVYHTVYGDWYYATLDDGKIKDNENYLMIGTLESYNIMKNHYGKEKMYPIYLYVDNDTRRKRAIERETTQIMPKLEELERRFKADEIDFSDENVKKAEIEKIYENINFEKCFNDIKKDIEKIINA